MKGIGGYFELELKTGKEYHKDAIKLNTGRNSLEYLLIAKGYNKIYLPYYTCDVLLQPIKRLGLEYDYYSIDKKFEPIFDFTKVGQREVFLYTNYFGCKDEFISTIKGLCNNLIVDNAQAFYSMPLPNTDTFYSPRKYFGVPDGAYLYTNKRIEPEFVQDLSYDRFQHLLRRIDIDAEDGYSFFLQNDESLDNLPILQMSNLTRKILQSIDYTAVANKRRSNFEYLHENLKDLNPIEFDLTTVQVPMVYPFLTEDSKLRKKLIDNKIYVARYWPDVLDRVNHQTIEFLYSSNLIHLPIDQRLHINDLDVIIEFIRHDRRD